MVETERFNNWANILVKNWDKYLYTLILFLNHAAFGITCTTFSPAMVDVKHIIDVPMKWISLFSTFSSIGYLTGALCGCLYKHINRQITLIVLLIIYCGGLAAIPYCSSLWTLFICAIIIGVGGGAWDNANYVWIIELWKLKSAPALQFSQFMFGVGTILGPLLAEPYLTGEPDDDDNETNNNLTTISTTTINSIDDIEMRRSLLKTPFLISGALQVVCPLIMALLFIIKPYKNLPESINIAQSNNLIVENNSTKFTENNTLNTELIKKPKIAKRKLLICLIALSLAVYAELEFAYFQIGPTYSQYIPLRVSASEAAKIMSAMATAYTVGRGLSAFIAFVVPPVIMISYHFAILIVGFIILVAFARNSLTPLWIANIILGYGFSSLWPSFFAFAEQYIKVTDKIGTIIIFSAGSISIVSPFIFGPFIEEKPVIFAIFEITYLLLAIALFITINFIIIKYRKNNAILGVRSA